MKVAPHAHPSSPKEPIVTVDLAERDPAILQAIIDRKTEVIAQQKQRIAMLEEYLRLARAQRFGPS